VTAAPNEGFMFIGWYESDIRMSPQPHRVSTESSWTFTVNSDRTLEARFAYSHVTLNIEADEGGTVTGDGIFQRSERVSVTATPDESFVFDGWYEDNQRRAANATWTFILSDDKIIEARFTALPKAIEPEVYLPGISSWAEQEVREAAEFDLIPPELLSNFQANITRHEFSKTVVRMLMAKTETLENQDEFIERFNINLNDEPFADTSERYIKMAFALGIVNGVGDNRFAPDNPITRQEAAAMLSRAAHST